MTNEGLLQILRSDDSLSQVCVTRAWRYILKGCHDLEAFSRYTDGDVLKIYAQNNQGRKPFAGKDFFAVIRGAQKIYIEARNRERRMNEAAKEAERKAQEAENRRNPKIRVKTIKAVAALCDLSNLTPDDVIDWDKMMLVAQAFGIDLSDDLRTPVV